MSGIGYLGPDGSYSHLAAKKFRPGRLMHAYPSFKLTVDALLKGECDMAVLPIENSINGGVMPNIDLLQETEGIYAFEECVVSIEHRLITLNGADPREITRIYSHKQALEQCGRYLATYFPYARQIAAPSTAACLDLIRFPTDAGIVGAHTNDPRFTLSKENIADEKNNFTRFLLVRRGVPDDDTRSEKVYFSATCNDKPGTLTELLKPISEGGLNMTKIESRPIKNRPGEYRFFIEIAADYSSDKVKETLKEICSASNDMKILGAY